MVRPQAGRGASPVICVSRVEDVVLDEVDIRLEVLGQLITQRPSELGYQVFRLQLVRLGRHAVRRTVLQRVQALRLHDCGFGKLFGLYAEPVADQVAIARLLVVALVALRLVRSSGASVADEATRRFGKRLMAAPRSLA